MFNRTPWITLGALIVAVGVAFALHRQRVAELAPGVRHFTQGQMVQMPANRLPPAPTRSRPAEPRKSNFQEHSIS